MILLCPHAAAQAPRELYWDALVVTAHLNADGSLAIVEEQEIVFSGDWNGGERRFDIRPRQTLSLDGMSRWTGSEWQPMREDASLGRVDDYWLAGDKTLRWRSRLPSDPPFDHAPIRYQLRYTLDGILRHDGDRFTLDHAFAFPNRTGRIDRFELALTLDPVWQPLIGVSNTYSAAGLAPGKSFVLTIPMRYSGTGTPAALDQSRSPAVQVAVLAIASVTLLSIFWVLVSERLKGRFVPVQTNGIDDAWLREHIFRYPAEIVSAAWDDNIGPSEIVTLIARMTVERTLESSADGSGMALRLLVDRHTLTGYERKLVDALFFDGRDTTSTAAVKQHYRTTGLDLVEIIRADLAAAVKATFPFADASSFHRVKVLVLFVAAVGVAIAAWLESELPGPAVFLMPVACLILAFVSSIGGRRFRKHMDRGLRSFGLSLLPALVFAAAVALLLWLEVGSGALELGGLALASVVALTLVTVVGSIDSLRSGQRREGVAFRKQLTAGRLYFLSQRAAPQRMPRDTWYPWLLAFDLGATMNRWSVGSATAGHSNTSSVLGSGPSSSAASSSAWSGFDGGRSGGAGASGEWAAAASGLAAGVSAPSSNGSSGSSGGSSSGGSSGGGGGGGW